MARMPSVGQDAIDWPRHQSSSEGSHYKGVFLMVRKLISSQVLEEAKNQRENIFHFSERGELLVNKQVALAFTLENYKDKVVCDVMPIEATHILLGRPLQFDRRVTHDGVTNRFSFVHMGQKVVLKPLSTREVSIEHQTNLTLGANLTNRDAYRTKP
ncbi:hypothetical protein CR513_00619, partial [Mucuna pruriens]